MRNKDAISVLFPGVRRSVLAAGLMQPDKWWYLSELADFLHTTPSSLQRELAGLVRAGILEQRQDGRRVYFKAEKRSPIYRDLKALFEKTSGLMAALKVALNPLDKKIAFAFLYGSVASRREHAMSDVDLMVVGNAGLADLAPALRKAERRLCREINVMNYSLIEFRKRLAKGDHFLISVLKGKIRFVKGERRDLDAVTRKQRSQAA
jgi:predicted nucleotidyltransferase